MDTSVRFYLANGEDYYYFFNINQASDGSLIVAFPSLRPRRRKTSQQLSLSLQNDGQIVPAIINTQNNTELRESGARISYHTTGQVNFHSMSFTPLFMEPLYKITRSNPFFILTFCNLDSAFERMPKPAPIENSNCCIIDIAPAHDCRLNLILSVVPPQSASDHEHGRVIINYANFFGVSVELVHDASSFNFSRVYNHEDFARIKPHVSLFESKPVSKNSAYLQYQHMLYGDSNCRILAPDANGVFTIVFTVEMRRKPWAKVDFQNPHYEARLVDKSEVMLRFRVFDKVKSRHIKSQSDISITGVELDAEIYDDESIVPAGYI